MIQSFRRRYFLFATDPALVALLPLAPAYILGILTQRAAVWLPALLAILALAAWQRCFRLNIGQNFQALPALPEQYRLIGQRKRRDAGTQACRELRRSLIQDRIDAAEHIPPGRYQAITHAAVLSRLERSDRLFVAYSRPIYMATLRPILTAQTRGRCRRCGEKCAAWNAPARQFYLVRFRAYPI